MLTTFSRVLSLHPGDGRQIPVNVVIKSLAESVSSIRVLGDSFERERERVQRHIARLSVTDAPCKHPDILLLSVDGKELRHGPGIDFCVETSKDNRVLGHVYATSIKVLAEKRIPDDLMCWLANLSSLHHFVLEEIDSSTFDPDY